MKVLVVGSGGREHALAWKISQSSNLTELYCAPGNPGTASLGTNVPISPDDLQQLLELASSRQIDLTVVGPEAPLASGLVDLFQGAGLPIAGPSRAAARLEGSKVFAKEFMSGAGIPTARFRTCDDPESAEAALSRQEFGYPVVIKADGLAAGKGVLVCQDREQARAAIQLVMRDRKFGRAGERVVIEEFLEGREASFMVFCDGTALAPMVPSRDHKNIYEGDQGPNTGGMGAYSADGILSRELRRQIMDQVIVPAVEAMAERNMPFRGVLYAGLMLGPDGPRVLEFNVRFGDPEAQVVLYRLESDLIELLAATSEGNLDRVPLCWSSDAAVCVVLASGGYPGSYETGREITGLELAGEDLNTTVFQAGTALRGESLVTAGGRVLGVTSRAPALETAVVQAYEAVNKINFEGMYYRPDIAAAGLESGGEQ